MIKRFIFLLSFILISILSNAATYYVSSNGNDNSSGTSISSPWRTISKVNSRTLAPGDIVLFERGGTYRGSLYINQSGTTASPITIGAYGSGNAPLFVGSQLATNWIVHQGNIWKTQISANRVAHLFYNDSILPIARFPNTGWLRNDNGTSTRINDSELNQPSGYWNGATVVVRSTAWSYDTANVTSYTTGVLNMTSIVYNLSTYNWGYFLRNKFELLDAPGEWFYDRATSTLYLYPITSNPNTSTVEIVTAFQAGDGCGISVNWQKSNVIIENLAFKHYGYAGVSTSGSNNVTIRNCSFDKCDDGIRAYGNGQTFLNNTLTKCRQIGINSISGPGYGNNNLIENNTITDCAIYPGLGKSNWGYFGLSCTGSNNVVRGNRLTRIGYIALSFSGNCLVENNVIQNACFTLSDGSGIAFDQTDGAIIRNNIVLSTLGNVESCATNFTGCDPKGKGIYFGNVSNKNNIVEGNTAAYCNGAGIWFDHTMVQTGNQIRNNVVFGNNLYQFGASDYSNYNGPGATSPYAVASYPNQSVTGNIFYSTSMLQKTMYHINRWYPGVDFADFNNNKYVNPWDSVSIQVWNIAGTGGNQNYSLSQWRAVRGDDALSTNQPFLPQSTSNDHMLACNTSNSTQSIGLPAGVWSDLDGNTYQSSIQLDALKSKPLYRSAVAAPPTLACKVWLQGPYNGTNMNDNLRSLNLIPLSDPYPALGYVHVGGGGATTTSAVLSVSGTNAIVDWILVEIRSATTPTQRVYTTSALLQRDGDIVATNGTSPLSIPLPAGNYHIAVRHRNHLGAMTANPVNLTVGTTLNFNTTPTWGVGAMININGTNALWAGDASFDGVLKYVGSGNDRDMLLNRINAVPTNIVSGYHQEDINLSGTTIYSGANNDRDIILLNIGGTVPTNTKTQQIP